MTRVYGILGDPVSHSLSPLMHHTAFEALRLDAVYAPFEVPPSTVGDLLRGLVTCGINGLNVTVPHKETIVPLLDELAEDARALDAVNTIVVRRGRTIGYNTDVIGFEQALQELGWTRRRSAAMILGSGGGARAVAWVLSRAPGTHLIIANRHRDRAQRLAEWLKRLRPRCHVEVRGLDAVDVRGCELLINATAMGMTAQIEAPSIRGLTSQVMVYD
ncbi:MAG: shikimate dehydrogenase, partial [Candidatus Omnitrophica bacterium]|nr:shikimate dehydrogenase [Candidatus Omnitrophota bacterium]